jgi:hypothetical protein
MFDLQLPRHISTLPFSTVLLAGRKSINVGCAPDSGGSAHGRLFVGLRHFQT